MPNSIYADCLAQSFVSDGNVFLKLTTVSGNLSQSGRDLPELAATLIMPLSRFQDFAKNVQTAATMYPSATPERDDGVEPKGSPPVVYGPPVQIPE